MKSVLRITLSPIFWIAAVQAAWTVTLVLWIVSLGRWIRAANEGWGVLVAGLAFLVLVIAGVTIIVVHFGRQVAQNRAMKDFVNRVSHDLRSPLAAVKLHLETLRLRDLDAAQRQACLEAALDELARLESGIEDVLTASRVEHRALQLAAERLDLRAFLDSYAREKRAVVQRAGGALEWEAASVPPLVVRADPARLRKMLDDLVGNALVHCGQGVQVRLGLEEQGRCAVLSVVDDGPGLERAEWKKVFRMFYRAGRSRRQTGGTGLGLFLVAGIAKAHGGRAWVDSPGSGKGCRFHVALPLARDAEAA